MRDGDGGGDIAISGDLDAKTLAGLGDISATALGFPRDYWDAVLDYVGRDQFRAIHAGGRLAGGLCHYRAGQWFGGRAVPMIGVAGVAIAPEMRGRGLAARLVAATLEECARDGFPLSALYASSLHVYRKVGFEMAGSYVRYAVPAAAFPIFERDLPVRRINPTDTTPLVEIHRARARTSAGHLERNAALWRRVVRKRTDDVHAYLVGPEDAPEGYAVFTQVGSPHYDIQLRDLVALTPRAARRLMTFLADHRSFAKSVEWTGPSVEPLLALLEEQRAEVRRVERWLVRIVDVAGALAARGWPPGVGGELHLEVADDLWPENAGRYVLRVEGGRAEVARGGRGELKMDVRTLAPLYTGYLGPRELGVVGKMEGTPEALAVAARLFAGPEPWMAEIF